MNIWRCETHWEQNDGNSQCNGGEDSQTHTEDESVIGVDPAVCVQQLGLNVSCGKKGICLLSLQFLQYILIRILQGDLIWIFKHLDDNNNNFTLHSTLNASFSRRKNRENN